METLAEFFIKLTAKIGDLAGISSLETSLSNVTIFGAASIFALDKMAKMVINLGREGLRTAAHYKLLNEAFGINTTWLQRMQYWGLQNNITAKQTEQSIVGIKTNLAAFSLGMGSQGFMQAAGFLGLNLKPGMGAKDIIKQLKEGKLSQFISQRSAMGDKNARAEAALLMAELGISPALIQELITGKKPQMTHEQIMRQQEITKLTELNNTIGNLVMEFKFGVFKKMADAFSDISGIFHPETLPAGGVSSLMSSRTASIVKSYTGEFGNIPGRIFAIPEAILSNLLIGLMYRSQPGGQITQHITTNVHGGTQEAAQIHSRAAAIAHKKAMTKAAQNFNPNSQ